MSGHGAVNIWTLRVSLDRMVLDADLASLDLMVREVVDRVIASSITPSSIVWERRGVNLTVRTQGDTAPLLEIGQWALDNMASPGPKGLTLERGQSAPLRLMEGWKGYDGN